MSKVILLAALCALMSLAARGQEKEKIDLKFGGRIDLYVFTDTYRGVESGSGVQYQMPSRPNIDPATGEDLNRVSSLRYGISSTRLNLLGTYRLSSKATSSAFVEVDFMGAGGSNPINLLRLRHAFFKIDWTSGHSLLFGQTSHLQLVEQIAAPTVIFGAGYPISPLARPLQVRYTLCPAQNVNLAFAASMFGGNQGQMQSSAMTPDLTLRAMVGDVSKAMIGATVGFKSLAPRGAQVVDKNTRLNAWSGSVFGAIVPAKSLKISGMAIIGQDMQSLGMTGVFAPGVDGRSYVPSTTVSAWIDLNYDLRAGFKLGLFAGYQKNLGTSSPIMTDHIVGAASEIGINDFYRLSPRLWYDYKRLSFGVEYLYTGARWSDELDQYYRPASFLPQAIDHRVMLLARFNF